MNHKIAAYPNLYVNTLCQICEKNPRQKAVYYFSGEGSIWLLCYECADHPSSKFSTGKDLTDKYDLTDTYIRDVKAKPTTHGGAYERAYCFTVRGGGMYMRVPGLYTGHTHLKVLCLEDRELCNLSYATPIQLLPWLPEVVCA